jgi:hypothetical protein
MIASIQNEGEGRGNLLSRETGRDMSVKHWSIMFFVGLQVTFLSDLLGNVLPRSQVPIRIFVESTSWIGPLSIFTEDFCPYFYFY